MFVVYSSIMKQRCGEAALGPVFGATFGPWLFMLGGLMLVLNFLPGWRQPFSNTFGYMVVLIPAIQAKKKLLDLLVESSSMNLIAKNPGLMLNEFAGSTFDETIKKLQAENIVRGDANVADFKKIILLKDTVADAIWYILVGFVAITTSFNIMMNYTCQKKNGLNEVLPEVPDMSKYTVTD
jgi:MFS family permease